MNCRKVGGIHFSFCNDCFIQDIAWNGCGAKEEPGLKLSYSSNMTIKNCSFQHSIGQAVILSEVKGDVNINHCQFVYNSHYKGHGAAVHYSSSNVTNHLQLTFTISNCNFTSNKGECLVYIKNRISEHAVNVRLYNSKFCHNQGTSIYVVNQKLSLSGKLLFQNNTAKSGTGFYITNHSTVIFSRNSNVVFIQNSANHKGGAVFLCNHSTVLFDQNSNIQFNNNKAINGTIYSKVNSNVTFKANCEVTFSNNSATQYGAAIYSFDNSHVTFTGNSEVAFNNNLVYNNIDKHDCGGIIYSEMHGHISMENNSSVTFSNNTAYYGGAIYSTHNSHISFQGSSLTIFTTNHEGGAIFSDYNSLISFEDNSFVIFYNNTADVGGGAISSNRNSHISFESNTSTIFGTNTASDGGAIYCNQNCHISFQDNSSAIFANNTADYDGGAIKAEHNCHISFKGGSFTIFGNNTADVNGGAILSNKNSHISFEGKSTTVFGNNTTDYGGAINSGYNSHISFKSNTSTIFGVNTASDDGGAIYCITNSSISFQDNSSTTFGNNTVSFEGAAIKAAYNCYISFKGGSSTIFGNNTAVFGGGAISSDTNSHISFKDNTSAIFGNNTAVFGGGAISSDKNSHISFKDNSSTIFGNNTSDFVGGAITTIEYSHISFEDNSFTTFSNNNADAYGGSIFFSVSDISFEDYSSAVLNNSTAKYGGAIYSTTSSPISFEEKSAVEFYNNFATYNGGAINCYVSYLSINEHSTVIFRNNIADYGGAVFAEINSNITFSDNSTITFTTNEAAFGATVYTVNSKITTKDNSSIIIDNHSAKWCTNTCLPYTVQSDVVTIDGNGIAWCSDQKAFVCLSTKCYCKSFEDLLNDATGSNAIVNITEEVMTLSSVIRLPKFIKGIIGFNKLTVICINGGRLSVILAYNYNSFTIEGINWIGCGGYRNGFTPVILLESFANSYVKIQKCSFKHSIAPVIGKYTLVQSKIDTYLIQFIDIDIIINYCNFMNNNHYRGHGAAVYYTLSSNTTITVNNCNFSDNHAASLIYISNNNTVYVNNSSFYNNQGVPMHLSNYSKLHINEKVSFENNVADNGAGIYISHYSIVTFDESSTVKFNNNTAINGTIYTNVNSNVTFKANCVVTFSNNSATQYGAAIYSADNSHVTFKGNSIITFSNNDISLIESDTDYQFGGTIFSETYSCLSFEEKSTTTFYNNMANFGAAIFSYYNSIIIFKDKSRIIFNSNVARTCGTLASVLFSSVTFDDDTEVVYNNNTVSCASSRYYEPFAGAICTFKEANIIFSGYSFITFINNTADRAGAVAFFESRVIMQQYSTVIFNNNIALYSSGGAFACSNNSNVTIKGNSNVTFNSNKANQNGGAIHSYNICKIIFKDNSISKFTNNSARSNGGTTYSMQASEITIKGNSSVTFDYNTADNGGIFYFTANSTITFSETSMISFFNNKAIQSGGVGYFSLNSNVLFEGNTTVRFENNKALYGGAILSNDHSNIILTGNSNISFVNNEATQSGGAGYFYSKCNFIVKENARLSLTHNKALDGGAVCINDKVKLIFNENSTVLFYSNFVTVGGGAVNILNDSSMTLQDFIMINIIKNTAQYGGAIFLDTTAMMANNCDQKCVNFQSNFAKYSGNSVYQDANGSCNSSSLHNRIFGVSNDLIATPPHTLMLYDPAKCIDNDNDTQCNTYYIENIMLGSEINIPACVLDYCNLSFNSIQFLVYSNIYTNYFISGPKQVLISCDRFEGVNIIGNQALLKSTNFSINISLNAAVNPDWKELLVSLVIELTPCHHGFWQYPKSKKCECYNNTDIVFCSGSSSAIKRGYWFGAITGKPTVAFCPINYCNFTCCETFNGYYHLSPVRDNQCKSHRSGIACGSCEEGYTLSLDSVECVHAKECSIGWAIIIVTLIVLYWIGIIVAVFSMMHFKVGMGYLYGITYYYSIVDIVLNHNYYLSDELYTTINVMSSIAKIIPQFLGRFCFITNMSGIDQQFIHYIHPVAISLFLVMITVLARRSRRLSCFISKGIIHVICCLLLLSYTSLATTSLLLMRPLIFHDVNKVYTYVSPDVKYFHGRHLVYTIVAILFTMVIVVSLPLLLALEPFLNAKINFVKVKPLLDQFQGCYKDKYRCFAAYYMICRLVIIIIVISNSSNDFIFQYLLISACVVMALIHQNLKPYSSSLLNVFDGTILHFLVLVSILPLADVLNNSNSDLVVGTTFILVILPFLIFIAMSMMLNKGRMKKLLIHCYFKCLQLQIKKYNRIPLNEIEESSNDNEAVSIIDDSRRVNVTICDV